MERHILKEQLRDAIDGKRVLAAVFYTFTFDPHFFEDYVMPLLVPSRTFRDEHIYNNILWRRCQKEGIMPPITVYCDHFAKDSTMAPTLGYQMRCIRLPAKKGAVVNFHPKESYILLEGGSILHLNCSANLSASGWCENLEVVSLRKLVRNNWPRTARKNWFQDALSAVAGLHGDGSFSTAEVLIDRELNYVDDHGQYFCNTRTSFLNVMDELIARHKPHLLEIISPYMYGESMLLAHLNKQGLDHIRCLVPSLKTNEILLEKQVFLSMRDKGVEWCRWADAKVAAEARNLHAKIYRLYAAGATITITGSVNFTFTAWSAFSKGTDNKANVESAIIQIEGPMAELLIPREINEEEMVFLGTTEMLAAESTDPGLRNAPELTFILNWTDRTLAYTLAKSVTGPISFRHILADKLISGRKGRFLLLENEVSHLSKNALIEIVMEGNVYCYYPLQLGVESRPLGFALSAVTILRFWMFDDFTQEENLSAELAQQLTGASGEIAEGLADQISLLNEFAHHFTALSKLEGKLFSRNLAGTPALEDVAYYLLSENLETVPFYVNGLFAQLERGVISNSFLWMVLQILIVRLYDRSITVFRGKSHAKFRKSLQLKRKMLVAQALVVEKKINGLPEKSHWIIDQLKK